jgi:hypothetical protein
VVFSASPPRKEIVASVTAQSRKYLLIFRDLLRLHRISFYLAAPVDCAGANPPVTDFPHDLQRLSARLSLDDWAVAIATSLLALILLGILPRIHW